MNKLFSMIFSASLVLGSAAVANAQVPQGPAAGQPMPFMGQPLTPAQASGTITRFIVGPAGNVRGFQLQNGTVVMVNGREGAELVQRARIGQSVQVQGFSQPGTTPAVIRRATVRAADGTVLAEAPTFGAPGAPGGPQGHMRHGRMGHGGMGHGGMGRLERFAALPTTSANGTVQTVLTGPHGHVHALLLSNNTTVMIPRPMAMAMGARQVRVGENIRASGRGGTFAQGSSVLAESLTFGDGTTVNAPLPTAPAVPAH